jgi:hypothetical protein
MKSNSFWTKFISNSTKTELQNKLVETGTRNNDLEEQILHYQKESEETHRKIKYLEKINKDTQQELMEAKTRIESLEKLLKIHMKDSDKLSTSTTPVEVGIHKQLDEIKTSISFEQIRTKRMSLKISQRISQIRQDQGDKNLAPNSLQPTPETPSGSTTPSEEELNSPMIEFVDETKDKRKRKKTLRIQKKNVAEIKEEQKIKTEEQKLLKVHSQKMERNIRRPSNRRSVSVIIPKESKSDFKILPVFLSEKKRELFERFTIKNQLSDHFKYYELYHKYNNEKDEELIESLGKQLYSDFIDSEGEHCILFPVQEAKIITKLYQKGSTACFRVAFRYVFSQLEQAIQLFEKTDFEKETPLPSSVPKDFDELIKSKEALKPFKNFVSESYGKNYIECFVELLSIPREEVYKNDSALKRIKYQKLIDRYCKVNSPHMIIFDPSIRGKILVKDEKISPDWYNQLYKVVFDVLSAEFYPRFINTVSWKEFVNIHSQLKIDHKFDDVYSVEEILTMNMMLVRNKSTYESFIARKFIETKENIRIKSEKCLEEQIPHDNIIKLVDSFNEEIDSEMDCLTLITTEVNQNLEEYVRESSKLVELVSEF